MRKNKIILIILICSLFILTGCFGSEEEPTYTNEIITQKVEYEENITISDLEDVIVHVANKCEGSVIGVTSEALISSGFGSGVIFKVDEGVTYNTYYLITNFHVISTNNKINSTINVYLGDYDETIKAEVKDYDKDKDLAILSFKSPRALTVATLGDSTKLEKGRFAIAIGNPHELKTYYNSLTVGYISHPNRIVYEKNNMSNYFIQHTAQINSGNSGGGLFNLDGELIGINSWKYAEEEIEGMGFAIPMHIVKLTFPKYFS